MNGWQFVSSPFVDEISTFICKFCLTPAWPQIDSSCLFADSCREVSYEKKILPPPLTNIILLSFSSSFLHFDKHLWGILLDCIVFCFRTPPMMMALKSLATIFVLITDFRSVFLPKTIHSPKNVQFVWVDFSRSTWIDWLVFLWSQCTDEMHRFIQVWSMKIGNSRVYDVNWMSG